MDFMALVAYCALQGAQLPADTIASEIDCPAIMETYRQSLAEAAPLVTTPESIDAISRVAYAEAGNQGDSGLAAVVYTILNRLVSGEFGATVSDVVNAPNQFEAVTRAGGWPMLPRPTAAERARIETIINLALEGHLPDLTNGARYFQNPSIVAERERAGEVSPGLTNFGGSEPSAAIGDHTFYPEISTPSGEGASAAEPLPYYEMNGVRVWSVPPALPE